MQIGPNKVVTVSYSLQSSMPGAEKVFVEETGDENPLTFLFGSGQLIPAFETNLSDLTSGSPFSFNIDAADAYGENDAEAIVKVTTEMFKVDGILDLEILKIGNMVPLLDRDGNQLVAKIVAFEDDSVMLDFNHPLAGQNLHFEGKVVDVREATEEELSHGHAHHEGMHDH
ncbi:FKBP-type peptidyl-prolyl cis-trans isomerase [soil metagenome]